VIGDRHSRYNSVDWLLYRVWQCSTVCYTAGICACAVDLTTSCCLMCAQSTELQGTPCHSTSRTLLGGRRPPWTEHGQQSVWTSKQVADHLSRSLRTCVLFSRPSFPELPGIVLWI